MCDCMLLSVLLGELYRLEPVAENRFCGLLVSAKETPSLKALALDLTVEARKLEHQYPHALKVKYKGS